MLEIASEITICLLLAALIGLIIGYLLGKMSNKKPKKTVIKNAEKNVNNKAIEEEVETLVSTMSEEIQEEEINIPTSPAIEDVAIALEEIEAEETPVSDSVNPTLKPTLLDTPKDGAKDALTTIKGIGPKVEEQLNAAGIFHFEQIANWNEENIQWLEVNTTFAHRAKKDLWVKQAKALLS